MDRENDSETSRNELTRRDLIKLGLVGVGAAMAGGCAPGAAAPVTPRRRGLGPAPAEPFAAPPMEIVRIGFVGVGGMGTVHCENLLNIEGVRLTAIGDIVEEKVRKIQDMVVEAGQPRPTGYFRGEWDFVRMCEEEDLDLVFNATPWRWHVPVCLAAMTNGKHAATEVPAAVTIDECWQLVEAAEKYQKHCVMMENVNYGRWEMMVFNMVRQGMFGEILHGEGGYLHDLRDIKFSSEGEGLWRRAHSMKRNGNLYPTHGLGPVANCMDVNRGDRFEYLVSVSSPSRGLQLYAQEHFPAGSSQRQESFVLGDVNVSLIKTAKGRTIFVSHDTNLPRPYSRIHLVQGTKGLFQGYPNRVHIEGRSPGHRWEEAEDYLEEFEHPLWKALGRRGEGVGHGGMDYLEDYRLIKCLREGLPTDMNVYDAVALSAVSELSERSVASRSRPFDFPDFTRGRWEAYPPLGIVQA
ncbi:MAG: Gfo/Idh/MocA family oxidoreductase [Gemmatimonadales bacterium]|nr:Gfo/Idh/MocA family oxidoreductase [Gemmatimonadales bacterium]NIN11131.1 Gfo/Idh/MocA family oxidoreductase [Gemmatimonadales bacterium]NIN49730.1 Gfo/Idh/MocA family oxidoreductase [Gemmatimonadales bacterium]NIP07194.1 Gfo/Idh/MocA family oxidoreductase [Gemmatimonadales bacterium]NIR00407.1 Gfo/Idh/MocA family oxidoreductase [Gemmatimonadales bacterium]